MDNKPEEAAAPTDDSKKVEEEKTHDIDYADPEEAEKVKAGGLKDVTKVTGTEGEVCIYKQRVKLYRFAQEQWKERGVGNAKLMRNDETMKIRFIMRQEKTLKAVANFQVTEAPSCVPKNQNNNEKTQMWVCVDFSDNDQGEYTKLCARFQTVDASKEFKEKFEAAQTFNVDAKAGKTKDELTWAEAIEDVAEVAEDDIDTNKTADQDGE